MKNINPENLSNEMSDALVNFQFYAEKIADLWNEKENKDTMGSAEVANNYPFQHHIEDVGYEIYCWVNAIRNYKPSYKIETINGETFITSSSGRKYILVELAPISGHLTYDCGAIFEWVENNPTEEPGSMWFGKFVNYFMGICTYGDDKEMLLDSARDYIEEYEKNLLIAE